MVEKIDKNNKFHFGFLKVLSEDFLSDFETIRFVCSDSDSMGP
jgi:hypothetical protein